MESAIKSWKEPVLKHTIDFYHAKTLLEWTRTEDVEKQESHDLVILHIQLILQ